MKERFETDFQKLERAVNRLVEVASWPASHDGRIEASIQCFEFVVELYWKLLKHMLREKGLIVNTPMDVFRESFAAGWIDQEDIWIRMLKDRNLSSHTYNESLANEISGRIPSYLPLAKQTLAHLKTIADGF
ncbi:MAG TPA: HI0074 family nucleotidyltransferase substrate-binding subunit [Micavibrio sp.]